MAIEETTYSLKIEKAERPTPDSVALTLAVPEAERSAFAFKPGQHIAVHAVIDGERERRTYSIAAPTDGALRIAIRAIEGGKVSIWANSTLATGATLDVSEPKGRFVLPASENGKRQALFIAAGAGITPIIGMITDLLEHEPDSTATLIFGNRSPETSMFLGELEDLKDRFPARFDLLALYSRAGDADNPLLTGRITPEKLASLIDGRLDVLALTHAHLCGPGHLIREARAFLTERGLPREKIFFEFFITGAAVPKERAREAPNATAAGGSDGIAILDGISRTFPIAPGQSVLEAALAAGIKAPYSCTGGMCCTCRAKLVEGEAPMAVNYSLEQWEIEKGFVLTCQARPSTPRIVVDYDAM